MPMVRVLVFALASLGAADSAADPGLSLLQTKAAVQRALLGEPDSPLSVKKESPLPGTSSVKKDSPLSVDKDGTSLPRQGEEECDPKETECQSLCMWLKLTDEALVGQEATPTCPLFEWTLKSCGWLPFQDRAEDSPAAALDCSVELLRSRMAEEKVDGFVGQLEDCVKTVPDQDRRLCKAALGLVNNEIDDWREETKVKTKAEAVRKLLYSAIMNATKAMKQMCCEEEAIEDLSKSLLAAEDVPGHYITEDIHTARGMLDKLEPIPPVRAQVEAAVKLGRAALEKKRLYDLNDAVVQLNASLLGVADLKLGKNDTAEGLFEDLLKLQGIFKDFKSAIFVGNVSLQTKSHMAEGVAVVNSSLRAAEAAGITDEVHYAKALLDHLADAEAALVALKEATDNSHVVLQESDLGSRELTDAILRLNLTIGRATELDVGRNGLLLDAMASWDRLVYIRGARSALLGTVNFAEEVLAKDGDSLSDDREEEAMLQLEPAMEWAKDTGIERGLPQAEKLLGKLSDMEQAKEAMTSALLQGSASVEAGRGERLAVEALKGALDTFDQLKLSASVDTATKTMELLVARQTARQRLAAAGRAARQALRSQQGEEEAISGLRVTAREANRTGLLHEAREGWREMKQLNETLQLRNKLSDALNKVIPEEQAREGLVNKVVGANDTVPRVLFNRTGLRPLDLPDVPNATDDGDANFEEHLLALNVALAKAKAKGVVDPELQMGLEHMHRLEEAYAGLKAAVKVGERANDTKTAVEYATGFLTGALREAEQEGLELLVPQAKALLTWLDDVPAARAELAASVLQGNVSLKTISHLGESLLRLDAAMERTRKLGVSFRHEEALDMSNRLVAVKEAFIALKAAIVQGEIALDRGSGEEAAINELEQAVKTAEEADLHREVPVAVDLLQELVHMNAEHQRVATSIRDVKR